MEGSRMKQRGMGTAVIRPCSVKMQYTNTKGDCWTHERNLQHCCLWAWWVWMEYWRLFFFFISVPGNRAGHEISPGWWRLRWPAQNAARPWRCICLKTLWTSGADSVTGIRHDSWLLQSKVTVLEIMLVTWYYAEVTSQSNLKRVQAGETYRMWLDADLPRSDDWMCGMLVWRNMRQRKFYRNGQD